MGRLVGQTYKTVMRLGQDAEKKKRVPEILERATKELEGLLG
jgi:hypothetical protein